MENKNTVANTYEMYSSKTSYHTQYKEFFEDKDGYPNQRAYDNFASLISESEDEYILACLCIDLKHANDVNYAFGNYVLRKFVNGLVNSVKNCFVFRIQGDKFNALVEKTSLDDFKKYVQTESQQYSVYVGLVDEPYVYEKNYELIQKGVLLMYRDRSEKHAEKKSKSTLIYGDKGNTPPELQETKTRKYRSTMWYSVIDLTVNAPIYKEVKIFVYPTKLGHTLETVPVLVVIYDMIDYRVLYGRDVRFGVGGEKFNINARFSREGHLNVTFFKEENKADKNYEYNINTTEGVCIPANFGKRIGRDEIYPIQKNIEGLCDYVLLKDVDIDADHEPQVCTNGTISIDDTNYGVYMDDTCIDLLPV